MVIHTRFRGILFPVVLWAASVGIGSYFVWHAINGERGLKNRVMYKARIAELDSELAGIRTEKVRIERRVRMLQADTLDRDLLDEEARNILGRLHKNELVVLLPSQGSR